MIHDPTVYNENEVQMPTVQFYARNSRNSVKMKGIRYNKMLSLTDSMKSATAEKSHSENGKYFAIILANWI